MTWIKRQSSAIFNNEFDLTERDLDEIEIRETKDEKNCYVWDIKNNDTAYNRFVLDKNSQSKVICKISFQKSSITGMYLPRPIFKRLSLDGDIRKSQSKDKVMVNLSTSDKAKQFWKLIGFLFKYKDLVEVGEFNKSYEVISLDKYIIHFKSKTEQERVEELKELVRVGNLSSSAIKSLTFESRKKDLKIFYHLLKNTEFKDGKIHELYRHKYNLPKGEESIWHHFLKSKDWILSLNSDIRFLDEILNEQKVGQENSRGAESPQVDMLGVSDFTSLIELKHSSTKIFKNKRSKGRANTWDFTSDFIEGVSQCIGQKFELEKIYEQKNFIREDGTRLDKSELQTIDPKSVFLIGNKKEEFPTHNKDNNNFLKNATLQRFRRNNRNVDILTFDELFERAYHIVYTKKLERGWYWKNMEELFD